MKYLVPFLQFIFAATFLISGLSKCIDPAGTAIKLTEYFQYFGLGMMTDLTMAMSWVLCLLEFYCGICLLLGHERVAGLTFSTLMMIVFTPLTLWLAVTDAIEDCGCFGDLIHLSNNTTFVKNLVLVAILIVLWTYRQHTYRIIGKKVYTLFKYASIVLALVLCWLGSWREPFVDFRPFTPGTDLRASVLVGGAEKSAEPTYTCIYERNGVRQEFGIDDLPDEDDGWEFVDTIEHLSAASQSDSLKVAEPIDFFVKQLDGSIYTEQLLSEPGYTFLLLSASLDQASQHDIDRIEQLSEYAEDNDYPFYCLTSRDERQYNQWRYNTGAEYPFLFTDITIVQTMCRSNPCLMLLHDGVICWKQPLAVVDAQALTSAKLNEQTSGEIAQNDSFNRFFILLILLFGPFALYLLVKMPFLAYQLSIKKDSKDA